MNIEHILVATDHSEGAGHALRRGLGLAHALGSRLTVLHVLERSPGEWIEMGGSGRRKAQMPERVIEAEAGLRRKIDEEAAGSGLTPDVKMASGKPFVEIIQAARSLEAGLVVLGAHGKHFFKDAFIGSTAERVVRNGDRSVLVVKQAVKSVYKRVLVAVDFSEGSTRALEIALRVAPDAEFHVLHAYQYLTPEEEKRRLKPFSSSEDYLRQIKEIAGKDMARLLGAIDTGTRKMKSIVKFGYPPSIIRNEARRLKADLVVVGATGKSELRHILLGSTASHALSELNNDLLVVREGPSVQFELP